jgi:hypothetical protein
MLEMTACSLVPMVLVAIGFQFLRMPAAGAALAAGLGIRCW